MTVNDQLHQPPPLSHIMSHIMSNMVVPLILFIPSCLSCLYLSIFFLETGTIDFNDFLTLMTQKMSEKDSKEEILKAFRLFDDDTTGKISFKNLKRVAKELGENLTDEELQVSVQVYFYYLMKLNS